VEPLKLKKLLQDLPIAVAKGSKDIEVTGITEHSQFVGPGNLFIARRGAKFDGTAYIPNAILAGALATLSDMVNPFLEGITQLVTPDLNAAIPLLAKRFYKDPVEEIFLIGVTGTSGKTTLTYLIKHLLDLSYPTGLMGGVETIVGERRMESSLTTLDCLSSMRFLREMVDHGQKHAVMEVSSHALSQNRVDALSFDAAIFTNLTPEHLDYHDSMESYAKEKIKLFKKIKKGGIGIVNIDSPYAPLFTSSKSVTYSIERDADYRAKDLQASLEGTHFNLEVKGESLSFFTPLLGAFNVSNTIAAISLLHEMGFSLKTLQERLFTFPGVRGRLELVETGRPFSIFVDHAHKEDALKNVLVTLQSLKKAKVFTLFGCGGDRDRSKRPRMAKVAEALSDHVIITSDNPRSEKPEAILQEIALGFTLRNHTIISDRLEAIRYAVSLLKEGDILLIAGKGHETKQYVGGSIFDFDDVKVVQEIAHSLEVAL
jgi:UDP-N-acetylmuramoyl-L-alanyl-D-glutamate--2,6-diaminopimelate ligase